MEVDKKSEPKPQSKGKSKSQEDESLKREVSFSDKVDKIPKRSPPPSNGKPAKRMKSAA